MRLLCLAMLCALSGHAGAQEAVFLIRHAEKELSGEDPTLTSEGRQRATAWAEMLRSTGLDAVLTSDARRTIETGAIVAEELNLPTETIPRANTAALIDTLQFVHEEDSVLVVGHAETIPRILEGLGVFDSVAIEESDFGNLFVVTGMASGEPSLFRLHMPSSRNP